MGWQSLVNFEYFVEIGTTFGRHNETHNENVVYFSVQYGSLDHLPWPHKQ